jgi:hypothetical protein
MMRAFIGFFLLAQSVMIYFAVAFIASFIMGPELIENSGTKGMVTIGIVTLIIQAILIKVYTKPDEDEEDLEESE